MPQIPTRFPGMGPIRGYSDPEPWATAEEVHGGPADPYHGHAGEQAQPYSWESQISNYQGSHGPYGLENGLLGDEYALAGEPAGVLGSDPQADLTPYRGHAAPMTRTLSGPLPSQYDAINEQLVPAAEIRSTDLGASRKFTETEQGDAQQDQWQEIWDVETGEEKYPAAQRWAGSIAIFGFGNNDRTVNDFRKVNRYDFNAGHHHRRFATGSIPGNYMWMLGKGRPLVKSMAGPARPAVGQDSPFTGDDLGMTYGIQGAVLTEVPTEYAPPPTPQMVQPVNYDTPAPEIELW